MCALITRVSKVNGFVYSLQVSSSPGNECVCSFHVSLENEYGGNKWLYSRLGNARVGKRSGERKRKKNATSVLETHSAHLLPGLQPRSHKKTVLAFWWGGGNVRDTRLGYRSLGCSRV